MTFKNVFIFSSIVALAYGLPLLFAPQGIIDMYSVEKTNLSGMVTLVSRTYGGLLIAFGIGGFMAINAGPSIARRSLIAVTTINTSISAILNLLAINNGVENSTAWVTVIVVAAIAVLSGMLLTKEKIEVSRK